MSQRFEGRRKEGKRFYCSEVVALRIVNRTAVALFARGVLPLLQALLLLFQLSLHPFYLPLLLLLTFVPLRAILNAVARSKMDRLVDLLNLFLQRSNLALLPLNLRRPGLG